MVICLDSSLDLLDESSNGDAKALEMLLKE